MQNKIGYHTCSDTGGKHSQVYEEITITDMGEETVEASVVQSVTTYDHATDTVTSGAVIPELSSSAKTEKQPEEKAEKQSAEIPPDEIEEPEEEQAEEISEEDIGKAEEQEEPATAEEAEAEEVE